MSELIIIENVLKVDDLEAGKSEENRQFLK